MAVGRLNPGRIFRLGAFAEVTGLGYMTPLENVSLRNTAGFGKGLLTTTFP